MQNIIQTWSIISHSSTLNMEFNQALSPNQTASISTRICNAREFLQENLIEKIIIAVYIYNLSSSTLQSSIDRTHKLRIEYDENNKIIQDY